MAAHKTWPAVTELLTEDHSNVCDTSIEQDARVKQIETINSQLQ